jgi:hypothetical protein
MSADVTRRCRVRLDNPDRIRRRAAAVIRDGLVGARSSGEVRDLVAALATLGSMLEAPADLTKGGAR